MRLRGARNKRYRRLSKAAILRLVRREGRLETRLMRMFERGGKRPLPAPAAEGVKQGLWTADIAVDKKRSDKSKNKSKRM